MRLDGIQQPMPTPAGGSMKMISQASPNAPGTPPRGQILVIVGLGMVALVAAIGLVIDLGLVWAANRDTQNGSDAAAHAGAIVLAQRMADTSPATDSEVDQLVYDAVHAAADANGFTLDEAEYTDWLGNPLPGGIQVGDGGNLAGAQGVRTLGSRVHETLLAQIVGIVEISVSATATAVSGPQADPCPRSDECALLPVTFPTTIVTCDGPSKATPTRDLWVEDTLYVVPICGTSPGSVGWIDWAGGGGDLAAEVCAPDPPELALPGWYWVSETGRPAASEVQACLAGWVGRIVLIPLFDDRCQVEPAGGQPCSQQASGGTGWYHLPAYAAFLLDAVHFDDSAACDSDGNGATSCLIGTFVDAIGAGQVAPLLGRAANPPSTMFAIQLIR